MQPQYAPSVRWEWISEAWNLFTKQWSVWVLMILVLYLIPVAAYIPFIGLGMMASVSAQDGGGSLIPTLLFLYIPVFILIIACGMSWMTGGLYHAAFKQIRGERIAVSDMFSGGPYFIRILGASILIGIAAGIGSIVIVGGLIVAGLAFMTVPMIVEGGKGIIDSIKESIEITKHDWIMFTLFSLALSFIGGAGVLACGVGVLATMPLLFLGHALAYRDCVGIPGAQQRQDQFIAPPPPDYRSYTPSEPPAQQAQPWSTPSQPSAPQAQPWATPTYVTPPPQPPLSESSTSTCPHCGATLARTMNFCNQCGRPLRSA